MKAIVLAAGIASRLRPLTDNTPKCLLTVGNSSLLERTLNALFENGVDEVIIVTGYLQQMIKEFTHKAFPEKNIRFIHNERYAETNNIYSLWLCKPEVINEKDLLLLDSDILFDPEIIRILLAAPHPNVLALKKHDLSDEEIKVRVNAANEVIEISKVCPPGEAIGESIGIEKMSSSYIRSLFHVLDEMMISEKQENLFYEAAFERLISMGERFTPIDITSVFSMELDTVNDFQEASAQLPKHLL